MEQEGATPPCFLLAGRRKPPCSFTPCEGRVLPYLNFATAGPSDLGSIPTGQSLLPAPSSRAPSIQGTEAVTQAILSCCGRDAPKVLHILPFPQRALHMLCPGTCSRGDAPPGTAVMPGSFPALPLTCWGLMPPSSVLVMPVSGCSHPLQAHGAGLYWAPTLHTTIGPTCWDPRGPAVTRADGVMMSWCPSESVLHELCPSPCHWQAQGSLGMRASPAHGWGQHDSAVPVRGATTPATRG